MFGYIAAAAAVIGGAVAAVMDLRTSEVPDYVSYITAAVGLAAHVGMSVQAGDVMPLAWSIGTGVSMFALGWLQYVVGAWGGADAFVMGAIGFALPTLPTGFAPIHVAPWPFALTLLLNVLVVGSIYVLLFAIVMGFLRGVPQLLIVELREQWQRLGAIIAGAAVLGAIGAYYISTQGGLPLGQALPLLGVYVGAMIGLIVLYRYLKIVEDEVMVFEEDPDAVEVGDVLAEDVITEEGELHADRIVGLGEDQLQVVQASEGPVLVKTGVRFIPTFPIAAVLSLTVGDLLFAVAQLTF